MKSESMRPLKISLIVGVLACGAASARSLAAQNPAIQEKVAEVKAAAAANKQALAQYTWVETDTISLRGGQKNQDHLQLGPGPDGKPQKTSLDAAASAEPSGGRLKRHIVEKK